MLLALKKKQQHKKNMSHNGKACKRFLENIPKRKKNNLTPPTTTLPPNFITNTSKNHHIENKQPPPPPQTKNHPFLKVKILNAKKYWT